MAPPPGLPKSAKGKTTSGLHILPRTLFKNSFTVDETRPIRDIKSRRTVPKVTKPSNWKDSEVIESSNKKSDFAAAQHLVTIVDDRTLACFPTGIPLQESPDVVQCKHCRKPVIRLAAIGHVKQCLRKKQEKLQKKKEAKEAKDAAARREKGEDDDRKGKGGKKAAAKTDSKKSKKRKAEGDAEKAPLKKKKKDEPKPKLPKAKMPVDVERQCGVPLPNGGMCARSLTCKTHSMGAKRSVPGRSLPYDMLLAQYQKKNQAKQQRAAIDANAPSVDDFESNGPVDPEEEKNAIMEAISRSFPRPIHNPPPVDIRQKYQHVRLKGILGTIRGTGLFSTKATPKENPTPSAPPDSEGTPSTMPPPTGGNTHESRLQSTTNGTTPATPATNGTQPKALPNGVSKLKAEQGHQKDGGSSMISPISEVLSAA